MNRTWNLNPALDVSTSWSSAHGRLHVTPAGDGVLVFWGGFTGELSDTLYCDTQWSMRGRIGFKCAGGSRAW